MPKVIFIIEHGEERVIEAPIGLSILEIAHQHKRNLEGAYKGSLACATCHVIVDEKFYDQFVEPSEAEEDMLDLAFDLTHTSRLGCQIIVTD